MPQFVFTGPWSWLSYKLGRLLGAGATKVAHEARFLTDRTQHSTVSERTAWVYRCVVSCALVGVAEFSPSRASDSSSSSAVWSALIKRSTKSETVSASASALSRILVSSFGSNVMRSSLSVGRVGKLNGGCDVVFVQLRVCGENIFSRLPCSEFFNDDVDGNPGAIEARLAHHDIGSDFDVLRPSHAPTLQPNRILLKKSFRVHTLRLNYSKFSNSSTRQLHRSSELVSDRYAFLMGSRRIRIVVGVTVTKQPPSIS